MTDLLLLVFLRLILQNINLLRFTVLQNSRANGSAVNKGRANFEFIAGYGQNLIEIDG